MKWLCYGLHKMIRNKAWLPYLGFMSNVPLHLNWAFKDEKPFTATQQGGFGLIQTKDMKGDAWQSTAKHWAMAQIEIELLSAILVWLQDTAWKMIYLPFGNVSLYCSGVRKYQACPPKKNPKQNPPKTKGSFWL